MNSDVIDNSNDRIDSSSHLLTIRRYSIVMLALIFASGLAGCATGLFQTNPTTPNSNAILTSDASNTGSLDATSEAASPDLIRPGDQLEVTVWGYPEFNTTATVKQYGTVTIPLVGDVMAAGMTSDQFKDQLKQRLSAYIKGDTRVMVSHIEMGEEISVMGSVTKQANYPALGPRSLVEVIAEAGGPSTDADLRHVRIFRNGNSSQSEEVDLSRHLQDGDMQSIPKVKPGDTVFVPQEDNLLKDLSQFGYEVLLLFGFFKLIG